jgi:hypothetical protein
MSYLFALNIGFSLYMERRRRKLVFIENRTDVPFITGDQPVTNLLGNGMTKPRISAGHAGALEQLICEPARSFHGQLLSGAGGHPSEPCVVTDNSVCGKAGPGLKSAHRGLRVRSEDAID